MLFRKKCKKGAVIAAINRLQKKKTSMWKYTICSQGLLYMHIINAGLFAETSIHIQMRTIFICFRALFFLFAFLFFVPVYFNLPVSFKSIKAKSDSLHLHFWFVSTSLHKNALGVFCEMAIKRQQLRKNTPRMVALPLYRYCGPLC